MADDGKNEGSTEGKEGGSMTNPVYDDTGHRPPMKRVYLYRILGHNNILVYKTDRTQPVAYSAMEAEIDVILGEIAGGLKPIGTRFDKINWRKRNYFVAIYEDPRGSLTRGNAVVFSDDIDSKNHTFHDGKDIPAQGEVRRFFCINHMRKKGGGDLGNGHDEHFKVTFNHSGAHAMAKDGRESVLEHSVTGTNTGPP